LDLVKINKKNSADVSSKETKGVSRRNFLKILGSASAVGATGCADSVQQNIFPNVRGQNEQIPGVAQWFSSTCNECSAGCGVKVRVREGRAVKVEGNPENPVNRGGLCGLGQSALQHHYDPDRIREPLLRERGIDQAFRPISWSEAYQRIQTALEASENRNAFVTGEISGSMEGLISDWCEALNCEHVVYEMNDKAVASRAAELVFGTYGVPTYSFSNAQVVLNFGADFLETWVNPVGYAREWAESRKNEIPARYIQVEPRLSLTGANADHWISAKPGTEPRLVLALMKLLLENGNRTVDASVAQSLRTLVEDITIADVSSETGVPVAKIEQIYGYLRDADSSLVLAGGASAATLNALPLMVATNLLNLLLGNLGTTINIAQSRQTTSSVNGLLALIEAMQADEAGVMFVHGTNPAFTLPSAFGFRYAARRTPFIVSFSSHLDDTTEMADLILPTNSTLESWGDAHPLPNVYSLIQPAMTPLYSTQSLGDILIKIADDSGQNVARGSEDYKSYVQDRWLELHRQLGVGGTFRQFWLQSLERGGYFEDAATAPTSATGQISQDVMELDFGLPEFARRNESEDILVLPFMSVRSFDGRAANRPWLQELPDPVTKIVWDSWAEIHPDTAAEKGIAVGDTITARNFYGEINVPAYITEHIQPGIIAVPVGQGHRNYGRYAKSVGGGNVLELLPAVHHTEADSLPLFSTYSRVMRARIPAKLVRTQEFDDEMDRHLIETTKIDLVDGQIVELPKKEHGAHHPENPKQMYEQREHPLYQWGMAIDLAACTGCAACVVACYAENNVPVVGKDIVSQGREMSWIRIDRYFDGPPEELSVKFQPMTCQHCNNAPCEPVCPVYATYHNEEGLNAMIYNRCVGTRYCANNCSYKVRRFNWYNYEFPESYQMQLNPDVTKRSDGVMEKCTFCVQRINSAKDTAKDLGRLVEDGEVTPACVQSCPTQALTFGNLKDPESRVSKLSKNKRAYKVLDDHINTQPSISYLENIKYKQ